MQHATIRRTRRLSGLLAVTALAILGASGGAMAARRHAPPADTDASQPDYAPPGYAPGPDYGGYSFNSFGFGNYTRGTDGGFGGYPPGSAGQIILQQREDRKCRIYPESC